MPHDDVPTVDAIRDAILKRETWLMEEITHLKEQLLELRRENAALSSAERRVTAQRDQANLELEAMRRENATLLDDVRQVTAQRDQAHLTLEAMRNERANASDMDESRRESRRMPGVGRILQFENVTGACYPAIVTRRYDEPALVHLLGLTVFAPGGSVYVERAIHSPKPGVAGWRWPDRLELVERPAVPPPARAALVGIGAVAPPPALPRRPARCAEAGVEPDAPLALHRCHRSADSTNPRRPPPCPARSP